MKCGLSIEVLKIKKDFKAVSHYCLMFFTKIFLLHETKARYFKLNKYLREEKSRNVWQVPASNGLPTSMKT